MGFPAYNGANNADDPLVTPWNIQGWTAQAIPQDTVQVANDLNAPAPLPSNLLYVMVTAQYLDLDNNPLSGFLTFFMSDNVTVTNNGVSYRMPQRFMGRDDTMYPSGMNNWGSGRIYIRRGRMAVTLMTTQNVAIVTDSGNPLTYHVVEHFMGGTQFDIAIPGSATSPVDLRSLIVPGSIQPYNYDPAFPMGNEPYVAPTAVIPPALTDYDGGSAGGGQVTDIDGGGA
jgi:hypothetical protein